jgi:hypothetical protein
MRGKGWGQGLGLIKRMWGSEDPHKDLSPLWYHDYPRQYQATNDPDEGVGTPI